ncbi:hypothetical protein CC99x_001860 [Candidatus Berkiella cookevillensis]|uniref:YciI-like protein n=1 Tax=Candidatus Berkiella cookevillensis TaxID=437022 RepID=A0A0Q9YGH2_9GAMM|nr:YciI family protein [Candidatus Berkiella cookevillensis]MCS5707644.1 hypothetical protein [Candidatus Berkiella cookevillensis]
MKNIFVVILRYIVPIETIDEYRSAHLNFLDHLYTKGVFITSGTQNPRSGGIMLAKAENRSALKTILAEDPFNVHNLAEYQIIEFTPTRYSEKFKAILDETQ